MAEQLEIAYSGMVSFGHRPFLTEPEQLDSWKPDVAVIGAPFDVGTTNRPGARFGPRAIRATAYEPGTYHLDLGLEIFDWLEVVDFGDAYCPHGQTERSHANIRERVHAIASRGIVPVILGGDHSITWPAATAVADVHGYGNVGIVHFDAHADTADIIEGNLASHGTPMRRLIRIRCRAGHPLRPGGSARLLAAPGHLRMDAGPGHDLAHHAGDLGPRLQGSYAPGRRRGARQGRQALRLGRHRRPGPRPPPAPERRSPVGSPARTC